MPRSAKKRRVSSGYSVDTRTPSGRSATDWYDESLGAATTIRTGFAVAFEYLSSVSSSISLSVSAIQSRPVMPTSKSPSAT